MSTPRRITLDEAKSRVSASAYTARTFCTHCGGTGQVLDEGRYLVHTRRGGIGADNELDAVLTELESAVVLTYRESSIVGPVVFARLPGDRGVSIDVTETATAPGDLP